MIFKTLDLVSSRNVKLSCLCYEISKEYKNIVKRPFVIIFPGGGYQFCSKREGDPVAFNYLAKGYNVFILEYSCKKFAKWPNPVTDYNLVIDYLKKNDDFNLDFSRFCVIGFSAGGHLAISTALYGEVKPSALILGYPSCDYELSKVLEESIPDILSDITPAFPRTFIFHAVTDDIVPISNSINLMNALAKNGCIFESHIYPFGPHGFSTGENQVKALNINTSSRVSNWVKDSLSFLDEAFGVFDSGFITDGVMPLYINTDARGLFTLDSTLGFLMNNKKSSDICNKYILSYIENNLDLCSKAFGTAAVEFALSSSNRFIEFIKYRTINTIKTFLPDIDYSSLEAELLSLNDKGNVYFKEYLDAKA